MTDFTDKLEPEIAALADVRAPHMEHHLMVLVSIAISTKRIADALDRIQEQI